jgi:hypothetical protein
MHSITVRFSRPVRAAAAVLSALSCWSAWGAPVPVPKGPPALPRPADLSLIGLRVDVRNLVGPQGAGTTNLTDLASKVESVNEVWAQCGIEFQIRSSGNVSAEALKVPFHPRNQDDLSKIAVALNPKPSEAIPFTVAGPWGFYDNRSGLFLMGIGWARYDATGLQHLGAMVGAEQLGNPNWKLIFAHELGHALSLPDARDDGTLMGTGNNRLTSAQCAQVRAFANTQLRGFQVPAGNGDVARL